MRTLNPKEKLRYLVVMLRNQQPISKINAHGQGMVLLLLVLILGGVAIYFGNGVYHEKYYVYIYDSDMVRYIDIPPYSTRKSTLDDEYLGRCSLDIQTSMDQVNLFLGNMCSRRGFNFKKSEEGFEIEVRPGFPIIGKYGPSKLDLYWTPILPEKIRVELEKSGKLASPTTPIPTKKGK